MKFTGPKDFNEVAGAIFMLISSVFMLSGRTDFALISILTAIYIKMK